MSKSGGKKKKAKAARAPVAAAAPAVGGKDKPDKPAKRAKVATAVASAKAAAGKIGDNPMVAEVVAAALVATAAALRNPKQARRMASEAAGELEGALKDGGEKSGAFWQLALDVARRSIEALEADAKGGTSKKRKS